MQHQPIKRTTLQATVFDPAPPASPWMLVFAAPIWALFALAVADAGAGFWLAGLATILALGARPRRAPRDTTIVCGPGWVRLGRRGPVLRARHVVGATTARTGEGVSLLLQQTRRKRSPIVLALPDEAALHVVCDSLGIGHHGFGAIDAVTAAPPAAPVRYALSAIALASLSIATLGARWIGDETTLLWGMVTSLAVLGAGLSALIELGALRPILRLSGQGVFVPDRALGSRFVPFAEIERVDAAHGGLSLEVTQGGKRDFVLVPVRPARWVREGLGAGELEHLAAQIRAAAERAHGRFALKDEPSSAVEMLRRQPGETLRAWFARLDTLVAGAAGYRTTALESSDLWKLLEDPEAEADLRSAAARVLAHRAPETARVRVVEVLAAVRDDRVRTRIAASIDDEQLEREHRAEVAAERKNVRRA